MATTKRVESVTTKISAGYLKRIDTTVDDLREQWESLEQTVTEFNDLMAAEWEKVQAKVEEYNQAVEAANELRQEIADEMQSYFDDKSEKWQEGDKGQEYQAWMEEWQQEFEGASLEGPDPVDFDVEALAVTLGEEFRVAVSE